MLLCFSADCLLDGQQSTEKRNPYQCSIYIVYLLMMWYKYVRNMQRLIDEINWGQIVHRVGFVKRKQTDSDTRKSVYMNLQICSENLQSCTSKENDDTHTHNGWHETTCSIENCRKKNKRMKLRNYMKEICTNDITYEIKNYRMWHKCRLITSVST